MEKKIKNYSSGESLAELLVAALIISLAMIMLFSGVKVGMDMIHNSRGNYQQYNEAANSYEEAQASYVKKYESLYSVTTPESINFKKTTMMSPYK